MLEAVGGTAVPHHAQEHKVTCGCNNDDTALPLSALSPLTCHAGHIDAVHEAWASAIVAIIKHACMLALQRCVTAFAQSHTTSLLLASPQNASTPLRMDNVQAASTLLHESWAPAIVAVVQQHNGNCTAAITQSLTKITLLETRSTIDFILPRVLARHAGSIDAAARVVGTSHRGHHSTMHASWHCRDLPAPCSCAILHGISTALKNPQLDLDPF